MAPYETQVQQREREQDRWCGDRRGGGWRDDPTQCGPSPKATCYQALRRAPIQSAFKYISLTHLHSFLPLYLKMAKCLTSTMWEPITGQGKPTPDANSARLELFHGRIPI